MKLIASLVLILLLPALAMAGSLPWKLFNEPDMIASYQGSGPGRCEAGEIHVMQFRKDGIGYTLFYAPSTDNLIVVIDPNPDDPSMLPTEVGVGHIEPSNNNVIPPFQWMTYKAATEGPSLCDRLLLGSQ